jgi:DsbC/DsbD-like thiol-disulfide interchange protein
LRRAAILYFDSTAMKTIYLYTALVATVVTAFGASHTQAQVQTPAHWTIAPVAGPLKTGAIAKVQIHADIQPGWHIYSITQPPGGPIATHITVPSEQSFELVGAATPSPAPRVAFDDAFHMNVELHEKGVGFTVPVRYTGTGKTNADSVRVNVRYQICNASLCYPPQTVRLIAPVTTRAR